MSQTTNSLAALLGAVFLLCAQAIPARAQQCTEADLHRALLKHDEARIEFQYKMETGYIRHAKRGDIALARQRNRHLYAGFKDTLNAISAHLRALDSSGGTFALVYEPSPSGCVWLIGPWGEIVSSQTSWGTAVARSIRDNLGVTVRSVSRLPRLRTPGGATAEEERESISTPQPGNMNIADIRQSLLPSQIVERIEESVRTLLVLPADDISAVPFASLPLASGRHLIDVAVPIFLPSVDGLFFWVKGPTTWRGAHALIVGDPDLSDDPRWVFLPLAGARREAEFVARMVGSRAFIGKDASFNAIRNALSRRDLSLVYFATHGIADITNPMDESFLALKDRHLNAARIKRLRFPAVHPLIVMSACQTGLGKTFSGGVFGLARAWIFAGGSQVLASLWKVDDEATAKLMEEFVLRLGQGSSPQEALREATLETRRSYEHDPALWGSFNLFGYPQPSGM